MYTNNNDYENDYSDTNANTSNENNLDIDENFYGYEEQQSNAESSSDNKPKKSKKIIIIIVLLLILACLSFVVIFFFNGKFGDKPDSTQEPNVVLSVENIELAIGVSKKIEYNIENDNGNVEITWSSSDSSVATVDQDGVVTALKEGTVTISAIYVVNSTGFSKDCTIIVSKNQSSSGGNGGSNNNGGGSTSTSDKTKPTLNYKITKGKENEWTNVGVEIKVTATDNSGSVDVKYTVNCNSNCKYTNVSNNTIKVTNAGSSVVTIVATDKSNNSTTKKVTVKIDNSKPICSLTVSTDGKLNATYKDDGGSEISYYGFSSKYSGALATTTSAQAGIYSYFVKDKAGNTNACSLTVKTKTQYRYQDCVSCNSCQSAGGEYSWVKVGSTYCSSENTKEGYYEDGVYYKRICYTTEKTCAAQGLNSCTKYRGYLTGSAASCDKCGCSKYGEFSAWSDSKYTNSATRNVETQTVYYGE